MTQKGQSLVEYILLTAIVSVLVSVVFKSQKFQEIFGENGRFSNTFRRQMEYSYRHALEGNREFRTPNYQSGDHDSYRGRFFGAADPYGE